MKKICLYAILFFTSFNISASHLMAGYIDFEVDSAGGYVFHGVVIQDAALLVRPNMNLNGIFTISMPLVAVDTLTQEFCGKVIIRARYKSNFTYLLPVPPNSGFKFDYTYFTMYDYENVADASPNFSVSVTVYPQYDTATQSFVHPSEGTLNSIMPSLFNARERGRPESIRLAHQSLSPGIDSVETRMSLPFINAQNRITWVNGFNQFAPFPDSTENPLNAANTITSNTFLNFNIAPDSDTTEYYLYGIRYNHFKNGRRIARQFCNGAMVLVAKDSLTNDFPIVDAIKDGLSQTAAPPLQVFNYTVYVNETFNLLLRAQHPSNGGIFAGNGSSNLDPFKAASDPSYSDGVFTYLNAAPSPQFGLDSNLVSFQWTPGLNNYFDGPTINRFYINFRDNTCVFPGNQQIEIHIELRLRARIANSSGQVLNSSSYPLCPGDPVIFKVVGDTVNFLWEHPDIVNTPLVNDLNLSFTPSSSSWLYLTDTVGQRQDSIYLSFQVFPNVPLIRNASSITFNTANLGGQNPDYWLYDGTLPLYNPTAASQIPIQASGAYSFVKEGSGNVCNRYSNQEVVANDNIWGSLFPIINGVSQLSYNRKLLVDFEVLRDKVIDSLFILGLDPQTTLNFGTRSQTIIMEVFSNGNRISQRAHSFTGTTKLGIALGDTFRTGTTYSFQFQFDANDRFNMADVRSYSYPLTHGDIKTLNIRRLQPDGTYSASLDFPQLGFKYDPSIELAEENFKGFSIYPNPTQDIIRVGISGRKHHTFEILSINGGVLLNGVIKDAQSIDISHLPKGIYYFKLANGSTKKIVKS